MDPQIHDNAALHRYELQVDGNTAYVSYTRQPGVITFVHTEVPEALTGKGIGSRLARHVLDDARARRLQVVAACPFIAAWMKKHPDYDDLLVSAERAVDGG